MVAWIIRALLSHSVEEYVLEISESNAAWGINVTDRSRRWSRDVRLRGGFELRCFLALSYLNVLKRFPNDNKDRNFRCL